MSCSLLQMRCSRHVEGSALEKGAKGEKNAVSMFHAARYCGYVHLFLLFIILST